MKKTLYLENSAGSSRRGDWAKDLDVEGVERVVVGLGPGSFAGIRSALAFAHGLSLGGGCEVLGLVSAAALVRDHEGPLAVVGDARQGKFWIALFDGAKLVREVFQVEKDMLGKSVPRLAKVYSPDDKRIGDILKETFGDMYAGERLPTGEGLRRYVERSGEGVLVKDPRPIYLNPAVRN